MPKKAWRLIFTNAFSSVIKAKMKESNYKNKPEFYKYKTAVIYKEPCKLLLTKSIIKLSYSGNRSFLSR